VSHIKFPEFAWGIEEPATRIEQATCSMIVNDSVKPDRAKLSCHNLTPVVPEEGWVKNLEVLPWYHLDLNTICAYPFDGSKRNGLGGMVLT
jgi:hypothetical protein